MTHAVILREATSEDLEFLFQVYSSTRQEELMQTDWNAAQKEAFLRMQFNAQHQYYHEYYHDATYQVIEVDGRPAGRLYLAHWQDDLRIMDIALLPEWRGQGIGTALLESLLENGRRSGRPVTIHVERQNPALRLYEQLGFKLVEDKGVYLFLQWQPEPAGRQSTE